MRQIKMLWAILAHRVISNAPYGLGTHRISMLHATLFSLRVHMCIFIRVHRNDTTTFSIRAHCKPWTLIGVFVVDSVILAPNYWFKLKWLHFESLVTVWSIVTFHLIEINGTIVYKYDLMLTIPRSTSASLCVGTTESADVTSHGHVTALLIIFRKWLVRVSGVILKRE